jgi:hypothetical protein
MTAKLTFISLIHSVAERDSAKYTIREAITIVRKEDNTMMHGHKSNSIYSKR